MRNVSKPVCRLRCTSKHINFTRIGGLKVLDKYLPFSFHLFAVSGWLRCEFNKSIDLFLQWRWTIHLFCLISDIFKCFFNQFVIRVVARDNIDASILGSSSVTVDLLKRLHDQEQISMYYYWFITKRNIKSLSYLVLAASNTETLIWRFD